MCPATIKFLLFSGWFVGSSDVSQKFRWSGVLVMVRSSDVSRLTDLDGSLSQSYQMCPIFIPVWTTRGQRLVFKCLEGREFQRKSGVSMVGSFSMRREFRHLTNFNSVTQFSNTLRVESSDVSREFRHSSGVPTPHIVTVTQLPLGQCKSY